MLLGVNYSKEAAVLLEEKKIDIDRFKCPDWPFMVSEAEQYCQVAVHFSISVGNNQLDEIDWNLVQFLMEKTGTPHLNLHLNPKKAFHPGIPINTKSMKDYKTLMDWVMKDIDKVLNFFDASQVILENVPYEGKSASTMRPAADPSFINEVFLKTDCGLLLDLSHARMASTRFSIDERDYISMLPLEKIRELHFTGVHKLNGDLQDHLEILDSDWPILQWALSNIRSGNWAHPWMLALEYGGIGEKFSWRSSSTEIRDQVPKIKQMLDVL